MLNFITFLSFFLCLALTPIVRFVAIKKGWIAYPTKDRWHKKPTALFGGIAIYVGIAIPLFFIADFSSILPHIIRTSDHMALPSISAVIWIGMTLLFFLGLVDDFVHIKPHTKLVGQILVASMVAFLGFRLHWFSSLTVDTTLTIVWIVGIINAFNLIDNMDGLCAGVGFIAASYLALLYTGILPEATLVSVIIAGALAAFLFYNFNPALIFMGDCGSLFIGFILSMLCLYYPKAGAANVLSLYAVPIMILMVPILDTSMVTLIRILSGRKASVGGKDHTSHRLVLMGLSEKGAVLLLYGIGAVSGIAALFVSKSDTLTSPAVIIPLVLSIILMGIYLAQIRVYPEKEFSLLRGKSYTPILIELTYKRQLVLVILDFCLIAFAYYLSYRLRFDSNEFPVYFKVFLHSLPAVIACKFAVFFAVGVYRGVWGYMSTNDVLVYLKASSLATIFSVVAVTYVYRFEDFSKGIFVIDWFLTIGFLLGSRGFFMFLGDTMKRKTLAGKTVLIYGAGRGGEILLREILNNKRLKIKPIGFIDDDELKTGKILQGYPIFGVFKDIEFHLNKYKISGMLISFNNKDPQKLKAIKECCKANDLFLQQFSVHLEDIDLEILP
ncbi:MAG: glycosyl transferase [Deltaproteobacteria bacterium]|nr:glycosyl transferase [Deltaproteobacteria bacterium]